jgi:ferredoxin-thioredoxin reductase catalytic chain
LDSKKRRSGGCWDLSNIKISDTEVDSLYEKLKKEATEGGYNLNPDTDFAKQLVKSLLINQQRYGYWACPCRLASGVKEEDIDVICPCDYRDPDLDDYGTCFCALYVSTDIAKGIKQAEPIPERRPPRSERAKKKEESQRSNIASTLSYPVWRCKVCGYLCARNNPPEICPICKAKKDRFEIFIPANS